ncbi:translocation and assembly module TamB [Mangrovibacterium diazotrophicum]|uniref:Translocation and assembly module TamB n=1 Tax=Mangrovibacterium diazotrophicum TaxID=1261403 RepID=A0A419VW55_9BACT|nr:translocation and assembly module TamB [Mangrovibacterium diazotrophicum]
MLVLVLIEIPPVKQKIARIAENQVGNFINGELHIGRLEGNFWNHLRVEEIALTQNNDTLASIKAIDLRYNLKPILRQELFIQSFDIVQPRLNLVQLKDSTWNLEHIAKEQEPSTEPEDTTTSSSSWRINLKKMGLENGFISIATPDSIIPKQIKELNITLAAFYSEKQQKLSLDQFSFKTREPDVTLNQFTFKLEYTNQTLNLSDFILKTALNQINGEALYAADSTNASSAYLKTTPIEADEFSFALPDLKIKVKPEIEFDAKMQNEVLTSTLNLIAEEQKIEVKLKVDQLSKWIANPDSADLNYDLSAILDQIKVDEWSGMEDLDYTLNGEIAVKGHGTDPKKLQADVDANLFDSNIAGYLLDKLDTKVNYLAGNLKATLDLYSDFGTMTASADARNIFGTPNYKAELTTKQLNLAPLLNNDSLPSDINLHLLVNGSGFEPKKIKAKAQLELSSSNVMEVPLDTAFALIRYAGETVDIDSLTFENPSLKINAQGTYSLSGQSDLTLNGKLLSLEAFQAFLPDAIIETSGELSARLNGTPDSLEVTSQITLENTIYDEYRIENASLAANGSIGKTFIFDAKMVARDFKSSFLNLDSINVESKIFADSLNLTASVGNKDLQTHLQTNLSWKDQIRIYLASWDLAIKDQQWELESPSTIQIDSTSYQIDQFNLSSNGNQLFKMNGIVSTNGNEDFNMTISRFNLGGLFETLKIDPPLNGFLNLNLTMAGTAQAPTIDGDFNIEESGYSDYNFSKAEGSVNYAQNILKTNAELALEQDGSFLLNAEVPFNLNLETMSGQIDSLKEINASTQIVDLPLALIQQAIHAKEVTGMLNGELTVKGTIDALKPIGQIKLTDGNIKIPEYGIDYQDMQLRTSFDDNIITLDTLGIRSNDGKMTGGGKMSFASEFYNGELNESTINLKFDDFYPINHKQVNLQLSGDMHLDAQKDSVTFGGDLEIPRSEIYLPTVLNMMGKVYTPEIPKPILVEEIEKMNQVKDTTTAATAELEIPDSISTASLPNITGKIKVDIPKNTWIKNPNLRLELSGDLDIIKHPEFLEIFGSVEVVRGQYELLGKTFVVSEGVITFEGGEEINPTISLKADYTVKNRDTDSKTIQLTVEGEADDPTISFTLDGESIGEGEALSYIVFGKGMNELSTSEQSDMSDAGAGSMAVSAAALLVSSQLSRLLGKSFNVDYIEVKSTDSFDNASLEVGKYLTNDLFVSYEQQIGATTDDDLSRYEVRLEYEILKFLFLQLNNSTNDSGFDVIFKVDKD